ncbi:L(+)-tartrate dehydratase subunit alpha [[Eubacterium] cellulosolvens]
MKTLEDLLIEFIKVVAIRLPDDVYQALANLKSQETDQKSKMIYEVMFENIRLAADRNLPLCQDTGILEFFLDVGEKCPFLGELERHIRKATVKATKQIPLRPNAVEVFEETNTRDNTGTKIPWIEWNIIPGVEYADITMYIAGGGSTLPGSAKVLPPAAGYKGIVEFVLDVIATYGLNACPPLLVGVGVGATAEIAAMLSKRALLRPLGKRNMNQTAAKLERMLKERLNDLKIGPQGLGGRNSVLDVHLEYSARHPATFGVGVSTGCWAHRRGTVRIMPDLRYKLTSYRGISL